MDRKPRKLRAPKPFVAPTSTICVFCFDLAININHSITSVPTIPPLFVQSGASAYLLDLQSLQSNINPRPARHLTAMPLPFYDPIHTLLEPQELPASVNLNCKLQAQVR